MQNRTYLKTISFILLQTFIVLDLCWASVGQPITHKLQDSTLAPSLTINNVDFKVLLDDVQNEDFDLDIDFEEGIDLVEDVDERQEDSKEEKASDMSSFSNDNSNNNPSLGADVSGQKSFDFAAPENSGADPNPPDELILPPPDESSYIGTMASLEGFNPTNREERNASHEITNQELIEIHGLSLADIGFKKKLIDKIVQENSTWFERAIWTLPHPLSSDELNRTAQGPFRVWTNTHAQNAVDLAASGFAIGLSPEQIYAKMLLVFNFDQEILNEKYKQIINVLHKTVQVIYAQKQIKLSDVYSLATKLKMDLQQIGIDVVDEGPNRRRTLEVRPHHIPTLRQEYKKNPQNMYNYLKYMVLLHEEGHTLPMGVLAHQLQWSVFKTKETALRVFRFLIEEAWPKELKNFAQVKEESEYRTQADVIMQSQWLYDYNPFRKDFRGAYWKEAIANYYAYLTLLKENNGNDNFAVEMLALSTHYGIQLNPPQAEYLELSLVDTINSFYPFLNPEQSKRWTRKVLELQAKDGKMAEEATRLLAKNDREQTLRNTTGNTMYTLMTPSVFTSSVIANQPDINYTTMGDGTDWLIATGVAVGFTAAAWAWKKLPFFKSIEQRTIQLVNKAARTGDPSALMKYYLSANVNDKIKIVNVAAEEITRKSDKVNFEIFENMFLDGLNTKSSDVIGSIQSQVISTLNERIRLGVNAREMKAILAEAQRETGINVVQGNSVAIEPKFADIINRLARENNLNANAFMESMIQDIDLDMSIDRMLVNDFVSRVSRIHRESGDINKAIKIVVSDTNDKYNINLDVNYVAAQAVAGFSKLNDRTVRLLRNEEFMRAFVDPYYETAMRTLFGSILKYMSLKQEAQSAALAKLVVQALHQIFKGEDINYIDSMFPELPMLVSRLAIEGKLHDRSHFVEQAKSNSVLASVMNSEQMRALHDALLNLLDSEFEDSDMIKLDILAAEFEKAGFVSTRSPQITAGFASAILGASNGENITLFETPLSQVGQKIKESKLDEQISEHYLFSRFEDSQKERIKEIIRNLDGILVNTLAVSLTFESIQEVVTKEINKLDLKNVNEKRAQLALINSLSKNAVLANQQASQAVQFENSVEEKVHELRYASAVALSSFAKVGAGTGPMVAQVKTFLREEVPNIRMDLISNKNIKNELQAVVDELKVPEKRTEQVSQILKKLSAKTLSVPHAMTVSQSAASDAMSGQALIDELKKESDTQQLRSTGVSEVIAPIIGNLIVESAI
jgi:hypothetical protein